ncbi:MAG: endonuclease/exonuclease/phosphatase family protein [Bacteroidetes bacterium]|nr:endonuclease/exonuclease/phosphatase family protein [Bacteroidota bacterium]
MASLRKFTKRFVIIANIIVVALFLLACANAFLHPDKWWFISVLGLIFPLLLILVFGFFIFWLFFYSRRLSLISLFALIIGIPNIRAFLALNISKSKFEAKAPNALRVLTWNVRRWDDFISKKVAASGHRAKMMDFIRQQNPDIICLQEFYEAYNSKELFPNIEYIRDQLHYPYYFFSRDYTSKKNAYETGVVIFSRYPITDTMKIKYDSTQPTASESLIEADINVNGKIIRICTTHLQSVLFRSKDFRDVEIIRNVEDSALEASKNILKKLRRAFSLRGKQADIVRDEIDKSPYPLILCGDFNDVPNSYTYFHIRGEKQDAYIKRGFGIGRTYIHLSPTLRIDYILTDKRFNILQCRKFPLPYSDHHPVMADMELP